MFWIGKLALVLVTVFPCWRRQAAQTLPATRPAPAAARHLDLPPAQRAAETTGKPELWPTTTASVEFDGTFTKQGQQFAQIRFVNRTDQVAGFSLAREANVWIQRWADGEWKTERFDWHMCGNGLQYVALLPGEERTCAIHWILDPRPFRIAAMGIPARWSDKQDERPLAGQASTTDSGKRVSPVIIYDGLVTEGDKRYASFRLTNPTEHIAAYLGDSTAEPSLIIYTPDNLTRRLSSPAIGCGMGSRQRTRELQPGQEVAIRVPVARDQLRFMISTELTREPNYSPLIEVK